MTDFLDRVMLNGGDDPTMCNCVDPLPIENCETCAPRFPPSPLGRTDALDPDDLGLRDMREAARRAGVPVASVSGPGGEDVPRGAHCERCGQLVGSWSKVHFAKVGDARACSGSWDLAGQKRVAGIKSPGQGFKP